MQYQVKAEMQEMMAKNPHAYQMQIFNQSDIQHSIGFAWLKKGKEFILKDHVYDIVKSENGKWYCLQDEKEYKLFESLESFIKGYFSKSHDKKNGATQAASVFFAEYIPPVIYTFQVRFNEEKTSRFPLAVEDFTDHYIASFLRPPSA